MQFLNSCGTYYFERSDVIRNTFQSIGNGQFVTLSVESALIRYSFRSYHCLVISEVDVCNHPGICCRLCLYQSGKSLPVLYRTNEIIALTVLILCPRPRAAAKQGEK